MCIYLNVGKRTHAHHGLKSTILLTEIALRRASSNFGGISAASFGYNVQICILPCAPLGAQGKVLTMGLLVLRRVVTL